MLNRCLWSSQEDQLIKSIVLDLQADFECADQNINWRYVSQRLKEHFNTSRNPRQCRDRWQNHLQPSKRLAQQRNKIDLPRLIQLQHNHGNKWKFISQLLGNRTHIEVKNIFYSTLKKGIRIVNSSLTNQRPASKLGQYRPFNEKIVYKLISQEQGKTSKMITNRIDMSEDARHIKTSILKLIDNPNDQELVLNLLEQLSKFNRDCRRLRKKKSRCSPDECQSQDNLSEQALKDDDSQSGQGQISPGKEKRTRKLFTDNSTNNKLQTLSRIIDRQSTESDLSKCESTGLRTHHSFSLEESNPGIAHLSMGQTVLQQPQSGSKQGGIARVDSGTQLGIHTNISYETGTGRSTHLQASLKRVGQIPVEHLLQIAPLESHIEFLSSGIYAFGYGELMVSALSSEQYSEGFWQQP